AEWGQDITDQALIALVALVHDLVLTIGIYALVGFTVTPATLIGVLTILGYSLYDTVVVFDKVRENTRGIATSTRRTYADAANLAVNQTLVRSINTSVAALLPVGAILYVGAFQLGSGPLKDLALALFVGMAAGAYSSIFIATPLLTQLKMLEPAMQKQAKRVAGRQSAAARQGAGAGARPAVKPASSRRAVVSTGASPAAGPSMTGVVDSDADSAELAADPYATDESPGAEPDDASPRPTPKARPPRPVRPPVARPMGSSAASKRAQPQRQTRSKRGKGR
ncbi:MAG TPA: protein translocase subunit SecF, partial [Nocardioidaceae bacterium]|nr:protein translocase subunit SecF [Nocardioidaceae bacterium]